MFKIVGADQKEYGPIAADQIHQWIAEGRANAQTLARFEDGPWKPLSTFPEFSTALAAAPVPIPTAPPALSYPRQSGATQNHPLSVWGVSLGVLGLLCCGPLVSGIGLVLSIIALNQINRAPFQHGGKGLAIAGIVLSVAGLILGVFLFPLVWDELQRNLPR